MWDKSEKEWQQNLSVALQAKSFGFVIRTGLQRVCCGLTEDGRGGWQIDFRSRRFPRCSGGLWLQCCTLHLFTAERNTEECGGRNEEMEGELLSAACCHLNNAITVPHYVPFQSSSSMHTHTHIYLYCSFIPLSPPCAVKASHQPKRGVKNK